MWYSSHGAVLMLHSAKEMDPLILLAAHFYVHIVDMTGKCMHLDTVQSHSESPFCSFCSQSLFHRLCSEAGF